MTKALRPGKVLLDWSQNHPAKTTSRRTRCAAGEHPTVAAPRTWDELEAGGLTSWSTHEVLERLATEGDLVAPLLDHGPRLPPP